MVRSCQDPGERSIPYKERPRGLRPPIHRRLAEAYLSGVSPECSRMARQMRSGVAGIGRSVMPSGARAWRIEFVTVGGRGGDRAASPDASVADWVRHARDRAEINNDRRQCVGTRNAVIHQCAGQLAVWRIGIEWLVP
jgi:hypothetical protein